MDKVFQYYFKKYAEESALENNKQGKGNNNPDRELTQDEWSIVKALLNYVDGSGTTMWIDFNNAVEDPPLSKDFPGFYDKVESLKWQSVHEHISIQGKYAYRTTCPVYLFLGDVVLNLEGTIISNEDAWTFEGQVYAKDEQYDFHEREHRPWIGELLTRLGMKLDGVVYTIEIRGGKDVVEGGV